MPKLDKKQRHKVKREAKRQLARRRNSISPIKRLADARGVIEPWMSPSFDTAGQVQIFVHKRAAGLGGVACFLVDRGIAGLKDAWSRVDVERADLQRMLDGSIAAGFAMTEVTLDEVRRMVAGGIRWAHDNGMRLPKDWQKTVSLIGGVGDWKSADTSQFAMEFFGHPEDLRQRLIREPFEAYIRRTDIDFVFSNAAPYEGQHRQEFLDSDDGYDEEDDSESMIQYMPEELDALGESLTPVAHALQAGTTAWLRERDDAPSSELLEAWRTIMLAKLISQLSLPDGSADEVGDLYLDVLADFADRVDNARVAEHRRGVEQALLHLETDPLMLQRTFFERVQAVVAADAPDLILPDGLSVPLRQP